MSLAPLQQHTGTTPLQAIVVSIRAAITKADLVEKLPGVEPFLVIKMPDTFTSMGKKGKKELLESGQLTTEQTLEQYLVKPTASWSPAIKHSKLSCMQDTDITLIALINLVIAETGIWDVYNGEKQNFETCAAVLQAVLEATSTGDRLRLALLRLRALREQVKG